MKKREERERKRLILDKEREFITPVDVLGGERRGMGPRVSYHHEGLVHVVSWGPTSFVCFF